MSELGSNGKRRFLAPLEGEEPIGPFFGQKLWPARIRLRLSGVVALVLSVPVAALGGFLLLPHFAQNSGLDIYTLLSIGLLSTGLLYAVSGFAVIVFTEMPNIARRQVLRACCFALLVLSVVLGVMICSFDKKFIMFSLMGILLAIPLLALERQVR